MEAVKKKLLILCLVALVFITVFCACTGKQENELDGKTVYDIHACLTDGQLECSQTVQVTNIFCDGLKELTFMLYPNAYAEDAPNKAYTEKLPSYGAIVVTALTVGGESVEFTLSEDKLSMNFAVPELKKGEKTEVKFSYTVTIPECALRLGRKDGYYNLSNFYPQLACFDGEKFRCDKFSTVGDPIISDVADFKVSMDIPENLLAACAGTVSDEKCKDGRKTFTAQGENMRDFAMVLNDDYKLFNGVYNDVVVNLYTVDETDAAEKTALAVNAIKTYSEAFGEYPYSTFTVAETPFDCEGMEFSGLVFVNAASKDFENTLLHETAHQWWYNLVGNDNINSPYLDEGLTTFTAAYYYLLNGDENKYSSELAAIENAYLKYEKLQKIRGESGVVNMNKSIYEYTEYQYNMLVYYKGCLMFKNLYDTLGATKFEKALKLYVKENRFGRAGKDELCEAFTRAFGGDASGIINGWLSDGAVLTAALPDHS